MPRGLSSAPNSSVHCCMTAFDKATHRSAAGSSASRACVIQGDQEFVRVPLGACSLRDASSCAGVCPLSLWVFMVSHEVQEGCSAADV